MHGFIKQSRGGIRVDSTPGEGTTFTLYLPALGGGSGTGGRGPGSNKRILLVEDDQNLSEVAAAMLEMMGFEVLQTHSASEALAELSRVIRVDLLFSDVIMPGGISGLELANRVRERLPELPVLLTTGFSDAVQDGVSYPLLQKPYTYDDLADAVKALT